MFNKTGIIEVPTIITFRRPWYFSWGLPLVFIFTVALLGILAGLQISPPPSKATLKCTEHTKEFSASETPHSSLSLLMDNNSDKLHEGDSGAFNYADITGNHTLQLKVLSIKVEGLSSVAQVKVQSEVTVSHLQDSFKIEGAFQTFNNSKTLLEVIFNKDL